ncbi:MAG: twin-arginine translocase subunit TatC [Thermoleophilaceae bacterium]|nr:twin-arginine translocase subunit TatC [Thermoleophilaceae bacterium]
MGKIKPIAHEDELSLVEHLDELRTRLLIIIAAFVAVLAVCFWQNDKILEIVNGPLPEGTQPATFAVSEAFMSTLTVTAYAALIITSPLIVYQLYAFVVPAFSEDEQRIARPLMLLTPLLFIGGCVFGYYIVLPAAVNFLLNFNADQFNILLRASDYYSFFGMTVLAMGALFEMPLAILIAARMGVVTSQQLRSNRRYAVLIIAIVAMLLPGVDPVSMLIEMVPLLLLFELSIWLTVWFAKPEPHEDAVTAPKTAEPDAAMR